MEHPATRAIAFTVGLFFAGPIQAQPPPFCTVTRIIDGDTFSCGDGETVRLLYVDTPEMDDEPFGHLAREFVQGLMLEGMEVGLELDLQERDRYGRVLAYVHLADGRVLNEVLARRGFASAMVIPPNVRYAESIRDAVASARSSGIGLWGLEGAASPYPEPDAPDQPTGPAQGPAPQCDASYPTVCIPPPPPDLDCAQTPFRRFRVIGSDPHRFDDDRDGVGCEGA